MKWFNFYGLIFIAVIMIPNIIFAMKHKDGFVNKYKNKAVETLEQVGRMPAKNNPNPAKTPIFPRFMPNSPSPVQRVRTKSPSTEIIENSDVLVACKYCGAFLG